MKRRTKVSYVKKPFAKKSIPAAVLSAAALVLFFVGLSSGVNTNGQVPLSMAAVCFCSLLVAFFGLAYGFLSMLEREKKYLLAKISMAVDGLLIVTWLVFIVIGLIGS